jgi:exopolysaccharide production protein ExoQ
LSVTLAHRLRSRHSHPSAGRRRIVGIGALGAVAIGAGVATGHVAAPIALACACALLAAPICAEIAERRNLSNGLAVEVPACLLLASTLVFRIRDAQTLAANPLDGPGLFRVACVTCALLLGGAALLSGETNVKNRDHVPLTTYLCYVAVVLAGALLSSAPILTAYRAFEISVALIVLAGARAVVGAEAAARVLRVLFAFVAVMIIAVGVGVIVAPGLALEPVGVRTTIGTPVPYRITGVLPVMSANLVGTYGALLFAWTLARLLSAENTRQRLWLKVLCALGLVTLLAAQYRTGYLAALAVGGLWLFLRERKGLAIIALAFVAIALFFEFVPAGEPQAFLMRGQSTQAVEDLSGRVLWWQTALDEWRQSPLVGRGLLTASRFDVLSSLGASTTATIHSTWVEALVGTGLLGALLLLGLLLGSWRRALRLIHRNRSQALPMLTLAVVTIRSITANTIESFDFELLLFLALALYLWAETSTSRPSRVSHAPTG